MKLLPKKYYLKDGTIYWHRAYYDVIPNILKRYGPGFGYNYAYYLIHPFVLLKDVYLQMKWFYQRGKRGYADCDVWSLDCYLARWMPEALLKLKNISHAYPNRMSEKGWNKKIDRMVLGFMAARHVNEGKFKTRQEYKLLQEQSRQGLETFKNYFFDLWD